MGIAGLWKIVEPTGTEIPLECLEGKKLAIDVSIWIYQAQTAYPSDQPFPHLRLLVSRLSKLLFYKIRPVFVFDGPNVPHLKRQVLEARRKKKNEEDDVLKNTKKLKKLKEIAEGGLDEATLQKNIQDVISPSKKQIHRDVYKDLVGTRTDLEEREMVDQMVYSGGSSSDDFEEVQEDSDLEIVEEHFKSPVKAEKPEKPRWKRNEEMQSLLDKRETIRNSRLRPDMIPSDSKSFSNFQMQRLLQRGRLNAQIEQLAKSSCSTTSSATEKIAVTGPDGTRHVLQYAHSDEIQQIDPILSSHTQQSPAEEMKLTLELFNVEYGGKVRKREVTPDDVREEIVERMEEKLVDKEVRGWQSKSGMLEAIARKRVQQHYGMSGIEVEEKRKREEDDEENELDISDDEMVLQKVLLESAKDLEERWDPRHREEVIEDQQPSTSTAYHHPAIIENEHDKSPELYRDLQEFLTTCGIPWIVAPGEAEAQCVELERLQLVDGVVSDDSDVWAFGVRHVYRHMFAKNRRVQRYGEATAANRDNVQKFCLKREDYITIGLLSGGDYCPGLHKVGAIGALELISEFVEFRKDALNDLNAVEKRILNLLSKVRHLFVTPPEKTRHVSRNAMMLRRHVNEANEQGAVEMVCSNREAVLAYLHPIVDGSTEKFRWRPMNLQVARQLLHQRLQWSEKSHEERHSFEAFEKWNGFLKSSGSMQRRLDSFFKAKDSPLEFQFSKKVVEALERIAKRSESREEEIVVVEEKKKPEIAPKKAVKTTRKKTVKKGKTKTTKAPKKPLNLSESSDDSFDDV